MTTTSKEQALELLEESRRGYLAKARSWAEHEHARTGRALSVDDVRRACPPPPEIDTRVMGAIFSERHWRPAGWTRARRSAHGRLIRLFSKTERADSQARGAEHAVD